MKRFLAIVLLLVCFSSGAQPIVSYYDYIVSSNIVVNSDYLNNVGLTLNSDVLPQIIWNQWGTNSHPALGPAYFYYTDSSFYPGGTIYNGFWMSDQLMMIGGFVTMGDSLIQGAKLTLTGPGELHNDGDYYSGIHPGISVTQNVAVWSGTISNLVAYTNVFSHGLLIASGPSVTTHSPSLLMENGKYLLLEGGGTILKE